MTRGVALAVVIGLFVVGLASGFLGASIFMRTQEPPPERPVHGRAIERLERDLGLTAEQRDEIRGILGESQRRGQELREEMRPKIEALMAETREQVQAVLDAEQQAKLDGMREGERQRFERLLLGEPGERRRRRPGRRQPPR